MKDASTKRLCHGCGHEGCRCDCTIAGLRERIAALEAALRLARIWVRTYPINEFSLESRRKNALAEIDAALAAIPETTSPGVTPEEMQRIREEIARAGGLGLGLRKRNRYGRRDAKKKLDTE